MARLPCSVLGRFSLFFTPDRRPGGLDVCHCQHLLLHTQNHWDDGRAGDGRPGDGVCSLLPSRSPYERQRNGDSSRHICCGRIFCQAGSRLSFALAGCFSAASFTRAGPLTESQRRGGVRRGSSYDSCLCGGTGCSERMVGSKHRFPDSLRAERGPAVLPKATSETTIFVRSDLPVGLGPDRLRPEGWSPEPNCIFFLGSLAGSGVCRGHDWAEILRKLLHPNVSAPLFNGCCGSGLPAAA